MTDSPDVPLAAPVESADPPRRALRPARPRRDPLAVVALVAAIVGAHLVGIVLGHLALARIAAHGRRGRGVAIAALVVGYAGLALVLAWWIVYFWLLAPIVALPG